MKNTKKHWKTRALTTSHSLFCLNQSRTVYSDMHCIWSPIAELRTRRKWLNFGLSFALPLYVHNILCNIYIYIFIYTLYIYYTGRTKVALVELPTVNMFGFFFCTPFPRRILAWSFVVPRSHFHPPKALKSFIFKRGWSLTVPHLPHKTDLKMWSAVDRNECFVKLSRSINFVPPEGYKKLI